MGYGYGSKSTQHRGNELHQKRTGLHPIGTTGKTVNEKHLIKSSHEGNAKTVAKLQRT